MTGFGNYFFSAGAFSVAFLVGYGLVLGPVAVFDALLSVNPLNLLFTGLILILALLVLYSRSIVNSVLALIGLASVFSLTLFGFGATFLAVLYLAVYIGAVAVFFLFVVMMTDLSDEEALSLQPKQKVSGLFFVIGTALACSIFILILGAFDGSAGLSLFLQGAALPWGVTLTNGALLNPNLILFDSNIEAVARALFQEHVASFLILSVVILVALVGAILLTSSINLVDKHELAMADLDPLSAIWTDDKLSSFGDGKPQNMEVQLARSVQSSVNLTACSSKEN